MANFSQRSILTSAVKIIGITAGNQAIQQIDEIPATIKTVSNIGTGIAVSFEVTKLFKKVPVIGGIVGGLVGSLVVVNALKTLPALIKEVTSGNFLGTE